MFRRASLPAFYLTAFAAHAATWTAENGNGTFTNPLFCDEFSDPDLIRVGEDFHLTGIQRCTSRRRIPPVPGSRNP